MLYRGILNKTMAFTVALVMGAAVATAEAVPADFGKAEWAADNWKKAVRYLDYITGNDIQWRLLAVQDTMELREQVWREFWVKYDPVDATPVNEYRQQYFERIDYANEHFATRAHPVGWRTDRGEVYVKMGPPADIQEYSVRAKGNSSLYAWDYEESHGVTLFFLDYGNEDVYLLNPEELAEHREVKWHLKKDEYEVHGE